MPTNRRKTCRTWPKFRLGSRCCTKVKTSPLAKDWGSHQPRPSCVTISTSPLPRRYFNARRVLSRASNRQGRPRFSRTAAQLTWPRNRSSSLSGFISLYSDIRGDRPVSRASPLLQPDLYGTRRPLSRRGQGFTEATQRQLLPVLGPIVRQASPQMDFEMPGSSRCQSAAPTMSGLLSDTSRRFGLRRNGISTRQEKS